MNNGFSIKRRHVVILVLLMLATCGLIYFLNRPGTLVITTEGDAEISISRQQGGEFKSIGRGTATYSSRDFSTDVYVQATKGGRKTISGATLSRGVTNTLKLTLGNRVEATAISDGAVLNARLDDTLVQGILPFDYTMTSFRTDRFETTRAELVGLPYMQKVVWYDGNNFVYVALSGGVGRLVNGVDEGDTGIAASVSDETLVNRDDSDESDTPIVSASDISMSPGRPLVLSTNRGLLASEDMGTSLRALYRQDEDASDNKVFTTPDRVIWLRDALPAATSDEAESKAHDSDHRTGITEVDYSGKKLRQFNLDASEVIGATAVGQQTYVLADQQLIVQDGDQHRIVPVYFKYAADIILYKDSVLILADNAIWKVVDGGYSVQLLSEFNDVGVGLRGSFSINHAGELLFGTTQSLEDTETSSKLFSINF